MPTGDRFLDCYNNVPVVGHCHPRVSDAIARQSRVLNTNMRYLHGAAIELAERLAASMPADSGLDTVLFVNSGSEANDTAWRLATVWTGARGGLASAFAYHGVTQAIADVSPEEWVGDERPAHVESFDPLDRYRDGTAPETAAEDLRRRDGATPGTRHPARRHLRRRGLHVRRDPCGAARLCTGVGGPHARDRGALRGRRGAGRARALRRRAVVVRGERRAGRRRDDGQADGERTSGGRRDHPPGAHASGSPRPPSGSPRSAATRSRARRRSRCSTSSRTSG